MAQVGTQTFWELVGNLVSDLFQIIEELMLPDGLASCGQASSHGDRTGRCSGAGDGNGAGNPSGTGHGHGAQDNLLTLSIQGPGSGEGSGRSFGWGDKRGAIDGAGSIEINGGSGLNPCNEFGQSLGFGH